MTPGSLVSADRTRFTQLTPQTMPDTASDTFPSEMDAAGAAEFCLGATLSVANTATVVSDKQPTSDNLSNFFIR